MGANSPWGETGSYLTLTKFLPFPGFSYQEGRHSIRRIPSWADHEGVCETVLLAPDVFYPDKPVQI